MGKRSAAGLLTSVDSIFTTQEERDNAKRSYVTDLSAAEISDFPNHPFKVRMDQSMVELADSVKQYGVLVPSLVRPAVIRWCPATGASGRRSWRACPRCPVSSGS